MARKMSLFDEAFFAEYEKELGFKLGKFFPELRDHALNTYADLLADFKVLKNGLKKFLDWLGVDSSILDKIENVIKQKGRARAISKLGVPLQIGMALSEVVDNAGQ